ncbi:MAG: cupin domain-containing protein [Pseudomonadota bacterium]
MQVNSDFSKIATVAPEDHDWTPSTQSHVERIMLDRIGEEKARATSLVRYAPNSSFPNHIHTGGEEIFVLSGTFSDESGDYSKGWYLRNPVRSSHAPFSKEGTKIFVKLWQMQPDDQQTVRINTNDVNQWTFENGRQSCNLFKNEHETTSLQRLQSHEALFTNSHFDAPLELMVIAGSVVFANKEYLEESWIRLPKGKHEKLFVGEQGATIYQKIGQFQNTDYEGSK